jgi:hypothetical protein
MIEVDGVRGSGGIGRYFDFFNDERPHSAFGCPTPASFYDGPLNETV